MLYEVVTGGSTSYLVEENQRIFGVVVENVCGFFHLDIECGFSRSEIVTCSDSSEKFIHNWKSRGFCGNKGSHLKQNLIESDLSHKCGFTGHVRPGQNGDRLILSIQID